MFPLGALLCVCSVLGHLAPVDWCARVVCRVASAVSWVTWLLFTSWPGRCVALLVRCPWPLGSRSPVCPLDVLCCVCCVLGHLAPVHRCSRAVLSFACAVSWAIPLLFTGVPARCVVLLVRCPGPLGSCPLVCPLCVLCCACGVLGLLASAQRCAPLVCCVACAVSWATSLLHTGARSVCCAVNCVCGASLRGAHSSIWTWAARSRPGLNPYRARTGPSGKRLLHSRQGLVALLGTHSSIRTAAGVAWHLFSCRGSLRGVRAVWECGTRRTSLLGTCLCALVVAGGLPLWRAPWHCVARCCSPCLVALGALVGVLDAVVPSQPRGLAPPALLGGCPARGTRRPAEKRAHCTCRWPLPRQGRSARAVSYPFRAPRLVCPWRVPPASVLVCVRCGGWPVWTQSLNRPVSRTVRRSTGDSAGAPGLSSVDADTSSCGSEDATPGSPACVRVLVFPGRLGRAGLPGTTRCASTFLLAAVSFCFARPPPGGGCPFPVPLFGIFFALFPLCTSVVSCFLWSLALGLGALFFFPHAPLVLWFFFFFPFLFRCVPPFPRASSGPGYPGPWRCVLFVLWVSCLWLLLSFMSGRWLPPGGCCPPPFCVSRCASLLLPRFCFLLCSCLLVWRSSAVPAVCPPPPLFLFF